MTDDAAAIQPTDPIPAAAGTVVCPWCSTVSPAGTARCGSCGAALVASGDSPVPGLTAIDTESLIRNRVSPRTRSGGILPFLLGTSAENDSMSVPSEAELATSLAPPTTEVQLEMVRLELDAERLRLEAAQAELESEAAEVAREAEWAKPAATAPAADPATDRPNPIISATSTDAPAGPEATTAAESAAPPPGPDATTPGSDQPAG